MRLTRDEREPEQLWNSDRHCCAKPDSKLLAWLSRGPVEK